MRRRAPAAALLLPLLLLLSSGCATAPRSKDYTAFRSADPKSILVVPVVNRSVDVSAPDYFLSTLPMPLAERGYYVFPVDVVKHLLEDDGLADAALVHGADTGKLCNLFGADSVLYATIDQWDAKYLVLSTTVTVAFDYVLKDCKTGSPLWSEKRQLKYSPQNNSSGGNPLGVLIAAAINAAIAKAAPNYLPMARQANEQAFAYPGPGLPAGPYHAQYRKDFEAPKP